MHTITSGNYVTSVHGMVHPNRIIGEHDFLYILDGTWEIWEDDTSYALQSDDLLILTAGRHHYGKKLCNPGNRHMYVHALLPMLKRNITIYTHLQWILRKLSSFFPVPAFSTVNIIQKSVNICKRSSLSPGVTIRNAKTDFPFYSLFFCVNFLGWKHKKSSLTPIDPMIEEIIRLIHSTPQTFFTAGEIASRYYICERTLNNRFHKYCKKTFPAFQMEQNWKCPAVSAYPAGYQAAGSCHQLWLL